MTQAQEASEVSKFSSRLDRWLKLGFIVAFVAIFALITLANIAEPDLWGHVRFGEYFIQQKAVPTVDPYSYVNQGFAWIDHEWLAEVIMALCYYAVGSAGLVAFKGLIVLGMIYLMVRPLRESGFGLISGACVLLFALQVMGPGLVVIRPHLFTYLLFALVCFVLRQATLTNNYKWLWLLPAIMVVWANCHGGFLSGLAVILTWAAVQSLVLWKSGGAEEQIRRIWLAVGTTFCAAMANPYGFRLIPFLLSVATVARPEIREWSPLAVVSEQGRYYLGLCVAVVFSLFLSGEKRHPALVTIVSLLMVAPLVALRHLPLFVIAVVFFAAEHLASLMRLCAKKMGSPNIMEYSSFSKLVLIVTCFGAAGYIVFHLSRTYGRIVPMNGLPVAAVSLLKELKAEGNMVCFFDWGEYIIWYLEPKVKVSTDGRRETAYPQRVYTDNLAFTDGVFCWDAILDRYPSNLVLIPKDRACYSLMKLKPGWTLAYEDDNSALFVPNGSALIGQIQERLRSGTLSNAMESGFP